MGALPVKRREFITLLGSAAAAWPVVGHAQQSGRPVIGFLDGQSFDPYLMTAFRHALKEAGYIEAKNVEIYFRSADGQTDRLVTLAGDIVGRRVAVIVTTGGGAAALAAYATTTTIPIVFVAGVDPVTSGIAMNLNRPGGNATGVYILQQELEGKRLGLLHGMVPAVALTAVLLNPTNANFRTQLRSVQDAARDLGQQVSILSASTERDIDAAFAAVTESRAGALLVGSDPFFSGEREQVVALAARHAVPAIYEGREFAMAGGLASYGTSLADAYRQAAIYAGRILGGEKPADLPVVQPTKFEFVINLKTAKTLGLDVPPGLSASADEIIE
jgi:putative ABC transport system substrate-binding protein